MKTFLSNGIGGMRKAISSLLATAAAAGCLLGSPLFANQVNAAFLTPRLIVTGSEITTGPVTAGDDFEMVIHMKNESTATQLNNVRIELTTEDNEIIPKMKLIPIKTIIENTNNVFENDEIKVLSDCEEIYKKFKVYRIYITIFMNRCIYKKILLKIICDPAFAKSK